MHPDDHSGETPEAAAARAQRELAVAVATVAHQQALVAAERARRQAEIVALEAASAAEQQAQRERHAELSARAAALDAWAAAQKQREQDDLRAAIARRQAQRDGLQALATMPLPTVSYTRADAEALLSEIDTLIEGVERRDRRERINAEYEASQTRELAAWHQELTRAHE